MKVLTLITFVFCTSLCAQTTIYYRYDAVGNRKFRGTDYKIQDGRKELVKKDSVSVEGHFVKIFPNPTSGKLNISIDNLTSSDQASYTMVDTKGTVILSKQSIINGNMEVDITSSPAGQYYMNVILNDKRTTWKIIKY